MSDETIAQRSEQTQNNSQPIDDASLKMTDGIAKDPDADVKKSLQTEKEETDAIKKITRFKRKTCRFCANKDLIIDYKNVELLYKFITDRGKILPRRITGNCAKHQRMIAKQIKRARIIALLPFVVK